MKYILLIMVVVLLAGCSVNPITDEQVRLAAEQCEKAGGHIAIFNTPGVSRCDCKFKD